MATSYDAVMSYIQSHKDDYDIESILDISCKIRAWDYRGVAYLFRIVHGLEDSGRCGARRRFVGRNRDDERMYISSSRHVTWVVDQQDEYIDDETYWKNIDDSEAYL